jgi:hypothetical protein
VFIEPMECLAVTKLPDGQQWLYEIKLDGYRAIGVKTSREIRRTATTSADNLTLPPGSTRPCTPRPELSGWAEILSATLFQFAHRK